MGEQQKTFKPMDLLITIDLGNSHYYYVKSKFQCKFEKYENDISSFNRAIRKRPSNPDFHYFKGFSLDRLGKFSMAVEEYNRAIELIHIIPVEDSLGLRIHSLQENMVINGQAYNFNVQSRYVYANDI